ncbi:MAG: hypothetical protein U1D30_12275 [Planctomycetota bacterium]
MLVFEKTGVAVNWRIVLWDRETGQPMYQFAPPPVRFAQPGFYKDRHIAAKRANVTGVLLATKSTVNGFSSIAPDRS